MASPPRLVPPDLLSKARQMRHEPTAPEWLVWGLIRDRRLEGLKFRRQFPVPPFIVDFYCHARRLVVEIDGASHEGQAEDDQHRQKFLEGRGFRVLRVGNDDVIHDLEAVAWAILRAVGIEPR